MYPTIGVDAILKVIFPVKAELTIASASESVCVNTRSYILIRCVYPASVAGIGADTYAYQSQKPENDAIPLHTWVSVLEPWLLVCANQPRCLELPCDFGGNYASLSITASC